MVRTRRALNVFVTVWVVALLGSYLVRGLDYLGLGLSVQSRLGFLVAFASLGLWVGLASARDLGPWTEQEVRDGARGWGFVGAIIAALPCFLLPPPWAFVAAASAVLVVVAGATYLYRAAPKLLAHQNEAAAA